MKMLRIQLFIAPVLIVMVVLAGIIGYIVLEDMSLVDAFYYTVVTISTVGYTDPATSEETRVFTIILILVGVATFFYFFSVIIETIVEGKLFEVLKMRRSKERLERIKDHVILCGYGDVGTLVAEEIKDAVIIERDEARFNGLIEKGFLGVHGDSTHPDTLYGAGIERANTVIIALSSDPEAVYTILTAKELNPEIKVYARANERESVRKMKRAGANYVICLPEIGSKELVNALED
ncbi:MAG: NAD-binding protein [Candidatus Altiarchaeota archaeon]|nr:NAD-binding protein [Candidatus Altiarchaeota archaeon]